MAGMVRIGSVRSGEFWLGEAVCGVAGKVRFGFAWWVQDWRS